TGNLFPFDGNVVSVVGFAGQLHLDSCGDVDIATLLVRAILMTLMPSDAPDQPPRGGGAGSAARLSHPWKCEKSPLSHASRSPGVLRSQSGTTDLNKKRKQLRTISRGMAITI